LNWGELLDPRNGGPGEPPGREELVKQLQEERAALQADPALANHLTPFNKRRRKGRSKRKTT